MAMKRTVASKNQCSIWLIGGIEFVADKKVYARQVKPPDVVLLREGCQHDNGAHSERVAHPGAKLKIGTSAIKICRFSSSQVLTMNV
jgi:hypothetical protein